MADSFSPNKSLILMQTGNDVGTWGNLLNNDCISIIDNNLGGNITKSVAGGVDVTLSSTEAENLYYNLTGVLTGNINVIWPTGAGFYIVANNTTGAHTLTIKPTGGSGIVIAQGSVSEVFISTNTGTAFLTNNVFATNVSPTFTGTPTAPTNVTATDSSNQISTDAFVQNAIKAYASSILYPVGSVYTSLTVATNPATLLGFGTWSALAGVAIVGVGTGTDSNGAMQTFTAGTQVGEYVHTLTTPEMPSHTHTDSGHLHSIANAKGAANNGATWASGSPASAFTTITQTGTASANIQNTGGGGTHNNVQPVIGAYMWERVS